MMAHLPNCFSILLKASCNSCFAAFAVAIVILDKIIKLLKNVEKWKHGKMKKW